MYNLLTRFCLLFFLSINPLSVFAYSYGDPSEEAQFFLELINQARANPERLNTTEADDTALPPLTFNSQLSQAASDDSSLTYIQRVENTGYEYQSLAESTSTYTFSFSARPPFPAPPSASETISSLYYFLDDENILSSNFKEIGIGFGYRLAGLGSESTSTVIFASSSNDPRGFILGVVYSDKDTDGFYSIGEGIADVQITVIETGEQTLTASGGGYALPLNAGEYNLKFSHPKFQITQTVSLADDNVKIDIINPVPYISGYVFDDDNNSRTYNEGEGMRNVQVTVVETGEQTTTDNGGYYDLALNAGHYTLEFYHEEWDKVTRNVDIKSSNIVENVRMNPEPDTSFNHATDITETTVTLAVNYPFGYSSTRDIELQYGLSSSYREEVGTYTNTRDNETSSYNIVDLKCGTLYHYRFVYMSRTVYSSALSDVSYSYGDDRTFTTLPCVACDTPPTSTQTCNDAGCVWSTLTELDTDADSDTCNYVPIDRFRDADGNLWKNPVRYFDASNYSQSNGTQFDVTRFAPYSYQNAIEGLFQIRHACQASWYSGQKDLDWLPANIVGAINYCVYPDKVQDVVTFLRETANQLACENNLPECNQ